MCLTLLESQGGQAGQCGLLLIRQHKTGQKGKQGERARRDDYKLTTTNKVGLKAQVYYTNTPTADDQQNPTVLVHTGLHLLCTNLICGHSQHFSTLTEHLLLHLSQQ